MPPHILGLTGLSCAGKSTAAAILAGLGAQVIDVDAVGHETLQAPLVAEMLYEEFGHGIFHEGRSISRKALGALVFADPVALNRLERIVHPVICQTVRERVQAAGGKTVVIDAAILHHLGLDRICSTVLLVTAPLHLRLERAAARHWTKEDLAGRDEAFHRRLPRDARCTIIHNAGSLPALQDSLTSLWKEMHHA